MVTQVFMLLFFEKIISLVVSKIAKLCQKNTRNFIALFGQLLASVLYLYNGYNCIISKAIFLGFVYVFVCSYGMGG
jgi:hypothetical protein